MSSRAATFVNLLDEVARARGRIAVAFQSIRQSNGLSEMEMVVLNAVVGTSRAPTVPQIGRSLGHPRQVIQRAADSLAERGLVTTRDNPDHKRARLLVPTEPGRAMKAEADARGLALATQLTEGIDVTLIETTVHGLHAIREAIEAKMKMMNVQGEA